MRRLPLILLALVLSKATVLAQSCPMCKESLTQASAQLSHGFYLSILSLFSLPFLLVGGVGTVVFRSWWKRRFPEVPMTFRSVRSVLRPR